MNRLDVLFICDGTAWTAQCLQYDVAAQGETIRDAQRAFEYVLSVEAAYLSEKGLTLDSLPAAPTFYWKKYRETAVEVAAIKEPSTRFPTGIADMLKTLLPVQRELRVV